MEHLRGGGRLVNQVPIAPTVSSHLAPSRQLNHQNVSDGDDDDDDYDHEDEDQ